MKQTQILNWEKPFITSFPQHANLFSIIHSNPSSFPWIYNHYIQLRINKKPNHIANLDFCTGDNWEMIKRCPFLDIYSQPLSKINNTYPSIIDYIIESIDSELYVILPVDWFYISISNVYKKRHVNHDLLCFGYDADKKIFHVADFFANQQYNHYTCTYEEIETSYKNINFSQYCIINSIFTLKLHKRQTYQFNVELFKLLLQDYLLCRNSNKHFYPVKTEDFLDAQSFSYGISVYDELVHLLKCRHSSYDNIPIRSFHVLYDHKILLEKAFLYLSHKSFYLTNNNNSSFQILVQEASMIKMMIIKYNLTQNPTLICECIDRLIEMKKMEINILKTAEADITETPSLKILRGEEFSFYNTCWEKVLTQNTCIYSSIFLGNTVTIPPTLNEYIEKIRIDQDDYLPANVSGSIKCQNGYHNIKLYLKSDNMPDTSIQNNVNISIKGINSAKYIGHNESSLGNWINSYGTKGYDIIGLNSKQAENITYIIHHMSCKIWSTDTTDPMVLINPFSQTKTAGCIFTNQNGSLEFLIAGNKEQKITLYIMDWYGLGRRFSIKIIDADSKNCILTCDVSCQNSGIYYSFLLKGHIFVEIQNLAEPMAPISGIFYD